MHQILENLVLPLTDLSATVPMAETDTLHYIDIDNFAA